MQKQSGLILWISTCFFVQVTPNLYGNIVANVVAGLTGGPGIMPGANVGNQVAVFEQGARHVGQDVSPIFSFQSLMLAVWPLKGLCKDWYAFLGHGYKHKEQRRQAYKPYICFVHTRS